MKKLDFILKLLFIILSGVFMYTFVRYYKYRQTYYYYNDYEIEYNKIQKDITEYNDLKNNIALLTEENISLEEEYNRVNNDIKNTTDNINTLKDKINNLSSELSKMTK